MNRGVRIGRGAVLFVSIMLATALFGVGTASADFGTEEVHLAFEEQNGAPDLQAGSHPFALTTRLRFNTVPAEGNKLAPDGALKDLVTELPNGFAGVPTATPRCTGAQFAEILYPPIEEGGSPDATPNCPNNTAVGVIGINAYFNQVSSKELEVEGIAPVYNLVPPPGTLAKFGFNYAGVPIVFTVSLSEQPPYRVIATFRNTPQTLLIYGAALTIWGDPNAEIHDAERGLCRNTPSADSCPGAGAGKPLVTMPTTCGDPLRADFEADSWQLPGLMFDTHAETEDGGEPSKPVGVNGCGSLYFSPSISAVPTSKAATSPTGLDFGLGMKNEGILDPQGTAASTIRRTEVTLPEGFTINPSVAEGLAVCSEEQLARETASSEAGAGCPTASKLGSVEVETPLLEENVDGALYQAVPYENPFHSLVALYVVLKNPTLGVKIVQPLKVEPDPVTGQLTAIADEMPQLPFSSFKLQFREGTRSPLATPSVCGSYNVAAKVYPWSGTEPVTTNALFEIITGPNAGPCPTESTPPFHPSLQAGTRSNAAGSYSPFDLSISRNDTEQEITHFSIKLPPGVTGKLAGIPFCSNADIAAAKTRERQPHGGQEELDHPSCPQASEVGSTLVGAGVGPTLAYVPGKVYLAGPYNGSNLSVVAITAAKTGPFDLGTVVIREALKVNPETAEVSVDAAGSDPIPHIIDGIQVHLRDIRVSVDRSQFVINPTSCEPTSTASTVLGSGTNFASESDDRPVTITSRFQAADCAALGFKPNLKLTLSGPTKRAGLPKLKAVVTARPGDANIGRAVVTLPKSEFLEQGHIGTTCTRVQFNAGGGNGEQCPARSVYGHAVAITPLLDEPLEGPVFLRSNGGERKLPDLLAALHSQDINIDLPGFIGSLHPKGSNVSQIRTTFASVPDAPVTSFTLEMFGGKKGLLVNSANLCKGTHKAISEFTGQNGKRYDTEPAVKAQCKKKGKKAKKKGNGRPALMILHHLAW